MWIHLRPSYTTLLLVLPSIVAQPQSCKSDPSLLDLEETHFEDINNETIWGTCSYPNPQNSWNRCGRNERSWLCDPDGVLDPEEANKLEELLSNTYRDMFCRCTEKCSASYKGHPIFVLLLSHLRIADRSGKVCIGPCHEVYPQLDPNGRPPTAMEIDTAVDDFTDKLLESWPIGRCSDEIIIVYLSEYHRLGVGAGKLATEKLGDIFESSQTKALVNIEKGRLFAALNGLINDYASVLQSRKIWPLVLGIILSVIVGALIIFGIIMTAIFCWREFQQGKTCCQVFHSCVGGENAILWGGNKPSMVPRVYESTRTHDESVKF